MKVYSLYDKDKTFLGAFPSRDMCVTCAKVLHPNADGWDYDVIEEYLHKSPISYIPPFNPFTNPGPAIPCVQPPVTTIPPAKYPSTYPGIYCNDGVRATWNETGDGV
jgi:hypothetical protein